MLHQVCSLSAAPVKVMTTQRAAGSTSITDYVAAITKAGYPVWSTLADTGEVQVPRHDPPRQARIQLTQPNPNHPNPTYHTSPHHTRNLLPFNLTLPSPLSPVLS